MNALQGIPGERQYFVTLNPSPQPRAETVHCSDIYDHPIYDARALRAQAKLGTLQGVRNTWFCGAYFGAGFHEDGLKSGLEAAEALGGLVRPWHRDGHRDRQTSSTSTISATGATLVP
jgi:predicted NAD/FAD-binding protein